MESIAQLLIDHDEIDKRAVGGAGHVELAQRAWVPGPNGAPGIGSSAHAHAPIVAGRREHGPGSKVLSGSGWAEQPLDPSPTMSAAMPS